MVIITTETLTLNRNEETLISTTQSLLGQILEDMETDFISYQGCEIANDEIREAFNILGKFL